MSDRELTRRSVLRAGAGGLGALGMATGSGAAHDGRRIEPESTTFETLGPCDVTDTGIEERLVTVDPADADPTQPGIGPGSPIFTRYTGLDSGPTPLGLQGTERSNFTGLCTANFVWKDVANDYSDREDFNGYYLGAAGHCFNPLGSDSTAAPRKWASQTAGGDYPVREDFTEDLEDGDGVDVSVCISCLDGGASILYAKEEHPQIETVELGDVVYARDEVEGAGTAAVGFDFGIVEIPADAESFVDPSMPVWGGPVTTDRFEGTGPSQVLQYGNGVGTGETIATKNRAGTSAFHGAQGAAPEAYTDGDDPYTAWYAMLPAAPGDSGSGVQTPGLEENAATGYGAAGALTHLAVGTNYDAGEPAVEAGVTGGTPVRECAIMAREDTRRVLRRDEFGADPFARPLGSRASFGRESAVQVDEDGPDAIARLQGEGAEGADVTVDANRLEKAAAWLREKGITEPLDLEVVTPERWADERAD